MNSWILEANRLLQEKTNFVTVSIVQIIGSAPRNCGSKMLITEKEQFGSVGGGKLEWEASKLARDMLQNQKQRLRYMSSTN